MEKNKAVAEMKSVLVTQSFGREYEYRRAIFMIWSFWAHSSVLGKVILFTDKPDYFEPYFTGQSVEYVMLTPSKIELMRGKIDFLHRMKISIIEEAFNLSKANLIYADSDTFFTTDPSLLSARVSQTVAFMHTREYAFEEIRNMPLPAGKTFQDFVALIDRNVFVLADGSSLKIETSQSSWNAGVMMFHPSHAELLPDVYALTDQFYPSTRNHASEQYAFSIVMQAKTVLHACDKVVYHYWYSVKKRIMDLFLEKNIHRLLLFTFDQKISLIKKWTNYFPLAFDKHVWMLRDRSIQAFHENRFGEAYGFATRAILRSPFDLEFVRNVAYHTKRWMTLIKNK